MSRHSIAARTPRRSGNRNQWPAHATEDGIASFLERIHNGDMPIRIRRVVERSLQQRSITLDDLLACDSDELLESLLVEAAIFDGIMGPTYRFWFMCALRERRCALRDERHQQLLGAGGRRRQSNRQLATQQPPTDISDDAREEKAESELHT